MAGSRLDMLKQIATGLAAQFGDNCEVVVHDLARNVAESSIVHIENGHITGRKVGDGPSGAVLNAIRHQDGPLADRLSYLTKTDSGRILKSSTIYINDDSGKPRYILITTSPTFWLWKGASTLSPPARFRRNPAAKIPTRQDGSPTT